MPDDEPKEKDTTATRCREGILTLDWAPELSWLADSYLEWKESKAEEPTSWEEDKILQQVLVLGCSELQKTLEESRSESHSEGKLADVLNKRFTQIQEGIVSAYSAKRGLSLPTSKEGDELLEQVLVLGCTELLNALEKSRSDSCSEERMAEALNKRFTRIQGGPVSASLIVEVLQFRLRQDETDHTHGSRKLKEEDIEEGEIRDDETKNNLTCQKEDISIKIKSPYTTFDEDRRGADHKWGEGNVHDRLGYKTNVHDRLGHKTWSRSSY
jgi:hypothetical protein